MDAGILRFLPGLWQIFLLVAVHALFWYSLAGLNDWLALLSVWAPTLAPFLAVPLFCLRPFAAVVLTSVSVLAIETCYPALRGWSFALLIIPALLIGDRKEEGREVFWMRMLIAGSLIHWTMVLGLTLSSGVFSHPEPAQFFRRAAIDALSGQVAILPVIAAMGLAFRHLAGAHWAGPVPAQPE